MAILKDVKAAATLMFAALFWLAAATASAEAQKRPDAAEVLFNWNRMALELVRHTPTYSPPVASRAFAYLGVTAYEAAASSRSGLQTLAGQLNGLTALPAPAPGAHDEPVVMHAALTFAIRSFFGNTGPTGQRAMNAMESQIGRLVERGLDAETLERSKAHGKAIGQHILAWSAGDGGAVVENLGFPYAFELGDKPGSWVPTSLVALQQLPLLPAWGDNRSFAMPDGAACPLPAPPSYSEEPNSEFYAEAFEVYQTTRTLSDEQEAIARFWSDDPMLSPTPPGHWISIALAELRGGDAGLEESVELLARLGITLADAFIGCWNAKYEFDLLRPVTYIRRHIDPSWQPLLITPPFPEYPSGHSTQSGAAAAVLSAHFGDDHAFEDVTHAKDGLGTRSFENFWDAAEEAAISRLYGGIHFRMAIERGLEQGRCVGSYATALKMRVNP